MGTMEPVNPCVVLVVRVGKLYPLALYTVEPVLADHHFGGKNVVSQKCSLSRQVAFGDMFNCI